MSCVYPTCTKDDRKKVKGLTLHVFPDPNLDPKWRTNWVEAVRRDLKDPFFVPTKEQFICSRHFPKKSFSQGITVRRLKDDSVPQMEPPDERDEIIISSDPLALGDEDFILPDSPHRDEDDLSDKKAARVGASASSQKMHLAAFRVLKANEKKHAKRMRLVFPVVPSFKPTELPVLPVALPKKRRSRKDNLGSVVNPPLEMEWMKETGETEEVVVYVSESNLSTNPVEPTEDPLALPSDFEATEEDEKDSISVWKVNEEFEESPSEGNQSSFREIKLMGSELHGEQKRLKTSEESTDEFRKQRNELSYDEASKKKRTLRQSKPVCYKLKQKAS